MPRDRAERSAAVTTLRLASGPTIADGASGGGEPRLRRQQSVGHVGRNMETTLGIARLHHEIGALARPASDQFQLPARPAYAWHWQRRRRQRRHAPSRDRSCRLTEIGRLGLAPPPPDRDADRARSL